MCKKEGLFFERLYDWCRLSFSHYWVWSWVFLITSIPIVDTFYYYCYHFFFAEHDGRYNWEEKNFPIFQFIRLFFGWMSWIFWKNSLDSEYWNFFDFYSCKYLFCFCSCYLIRILTKLGALNIWAIHFFFYFSRGNTFLSELIFCFKL